MVPFLQNRTFTFPRLQQPLRTLGKRTSTTRGEEENKETTGIYRLSLSSPASMNKELERAETDCWWPEKVRWYQSTTCVSEGRGDCAADLSSSSTISLLLHSNLRNPLENAVVGRGPLGLWHWQGLFCPLQQ